MRRTWSYLIIHFLICRILLSRIAESPFETERVIPVCKIHSYDIQKREYTWAYKTYPPKNVLEIFSLPLFFWFLDFFKCHNRTWIFIVSYVLYHFIYPEIFSFVVWFLIFVVNHSFLEFWTINLRQKVHRFHYVFYRSRIMIHAI